MKLPEILSINRVEVYKQNKLAGHLYRTKKGSAFEYDHDYYQDQQLALSFHISINSKRLTTTGENLHPYFAGLLPEGLRLTALQSALKTSKSDLFSMLVASGEDVIGDVYVMPDKNLQVSDKIKLESFTDVDFLELFKSSIYSTDYSIRRIDSAIAGVQPKISAQMISFPIKHTKRNKSYILKLETKDHPNLVKNEHFFMELAKLCGISVANTQIVYDRNKQAGLLVERFDRVYNKKTASVLRYHQEDACQFLNIYPQDKYRLHFREIAKGIQKFATAPILEISKLTEILAFSYIIANGDLHAKNISLIYGEDPNQIILSPAYDLLTTLPYGDQSMALAFEGRKDNFTFEIFSNFAKTFAIPDKIIKRSIERISEVIDKHIQNIDQLNFNNKQTTFLKKTIKQRIRDLTK